jgi:hypothetical protein
VNPRAVRDEKGRAVLAQAPSGSGLWTFRTRPVKDEGSSNLVGRTGEIITRTVHTVILESTRETAVEDRLFVDARKRAAQILEVDPLELELIKCPT